MTTSSDPLRTDRPSPRVPSAASTTAAAPDPDEAADLAFVESASGTDDPPPPVRGGLGRLLAWILPANLGIYILWGAIPGVLLPQQVALIGGEADKVGNLAIVATIGAFAAMVAQPVAGQLSDRTRSRFGRRAPWILLGAVAGALALVGLAFAGSLVAVAIAWTIVQISFNCAQGPLSAILPDRVPVRRRGTFSALAGMGVMLGGLGGQVLASFFFNSVTIGYLVFAAFSLLMLGLFLAFNPDHSSRDLRPEPFRLLDFLRTFWVNPIAHPDFFWAFTGRLLLYTGYFAVTGYQLFILTDYIGLEAPETVIPLFGLVSLAGIIIATVVSGPLSDRVGRRKIFVFLSAVAVAVALVIPWIMPTFEGWLLMTAIAGIGFGMFQAVDQALMSEVLPSARSFGKDLGVVNIAATLPQTLAPGIAGLIVLAFGYAGLFPVGIVLSLLGALAVWPIRIVR